MATITPPLGPQVLHRLASIVGDYVDMAGVPGSAHGDVGELAAAAVGQDVDAIDGRSLHTVDDQRNAKLVIETCLLRDASGTDLYRRNKPGGNERGRPVAAG